MKKGIRRLLVGTKGSGFPRGRKLLQSTLLIGGSTLLLTSTQAGTFTWNGLASKNWTGANWNEGAPNNDGTDDIHMAGINRLSNRANGGWDINSLAFDAGAGPFVISGFSTDEILLEGGGIINNSTTLQTLNQPLLLNANQTWNAASGAFSFGGTLNLFNFTLSLTGPQNILEGGVVSGNGGITKTGAGTLTLSANNAFAGGVNVSAGTVVSASDSALGSGALTMSGGAMLQGGGGNRLIGNSINFAGSAVIGGPNNLTLAGPLSGNGSLTKADANTVTLVAASPYSGALTINGGTLAAGTAGALGSVASIVVNNSTFQLANTGAGAINDVAPLTLNHGNLFGNDQNERFGALFIANDSSITLIPDNIHATLEFANLSISLGETLDINGWSGVELPDGTVPSLDDMILVDDNPGAAVLSGIYFAGFQAGATWDPVTHEVRPIPEPAVSALVAAGLAAYALSRRRRR